VWDPYTVALLFRQVARDQGGRSRVTRRQERVARNEATTRDINEDIERTYLEEGLSTAGSGHVRVLCECGRDDCDRLLAMTLGEYEAVRADPRRFAVVSSHVMPDVEQVVDRTDRYVVVAKREGTPAAIAVEEDPRS
jgi:hypothetical protein